MALKFLNKKGWHTGSLRNIENVWKAEQKHDAEQKKLDELRKQIHEERERSEFRQLQEQAGLVPRQERLDFLYDSGLAVGRSDGGGGGAAASGSGFKALDQASAAPSSAAAGSGKQQSSAPGALFEDKPHSASDAWRKLHSDPLLSIRQREQEALARVKNNPVKMALIRKSVEEKKHKDKSHDKKERKRKKHQKHSDSDDAMSSEEEKPRRSRNQKSSYHEEERHYNKRSSSGDELSDRRDRNRNHKDLKYREQSPSVLEEHHYNKRSDSRDEFSDRRDRKTSHYKDSKYRERSPGGLAEPKHTRSDAQDSMKRDYDKSKHERYPSEVQRDYDADRKGRENKSYRESNRSDNSAAANRSESSYLRRNVAPVSKISEEERAARLREMQVNAKVHEEERWKRLRKAEEDDARESSRDGVVSGKNFLETARKSVFGAEKGGSSTIEESVRRRTHYLQGRSESESNAFRR